MEPVNLDTNAAHTSKSDDQLRMSRALTIASTNQGKIAEYSRLLGREVSGVKLAIPELQMEKAEVRGVLSGNYAEVAASLARTKAMNAYKLFDGPVLIEDTWVSLAGVQGQPGPFYSQFESLEYNRTLCQIVHNLPAEDGGKRSPRAVAIVTLAMWNGEPDCMADVWQGVTVGEIAKSPRGTNGFGWDNIFIPLNDSGKPVAVNEGDSLGLEACDFGKTFAEMSAEEKDLASMRRKALELFLSGTTPK